MEHLWTWLLGLRADIAFVLGIALALCATTHILLRKRDVASAAGWIGLTWFVPFTGTILYILFGINRVQRRAQRRRPKRRRVRRQQKTTGHAELTPLQRAIGRITHRPIVFGNTIDCYDNGDEAYPAMLAAIASARLSVGLSSYIFDDDQWGGRFIDALSQARQRGVAVLVLIDGVGGGYFRSPAYHRLRHEGVAVARFLHSLLPWRMPFVNLRSHKKILVVDGVVGFTGGMNIADQNVMATHPKAPVQDTHFRLQGPIVSQLTENFLQDWAFTTDEMIDGVDWFPNTDPDDSGSAAPARVVDAGPDAEMEKVELAVLEALACAQTSVRVMTPYFLPDDRLITALSLASMRGVAVEIVIPQQSDRKIVDWAVRPNSAPLLRDGAKIWLSPPPFRHSKLLVVDEEWCLFGSSNWDVRSFRLNFELCVEVYDPELGRTFAAEIERCRGAKLTLSEIEARSLPVRLRDAAARMTLPYI